MNQTFVNAGKQILKDLLSQCTEPQQLMFKRMYCHKNINLSITDAVDQMDETKIDWAITQCEHTINKTKPPTKCDDEIEKIKRWDDGGCSMGTDDSKIY